jgi:hypothetical protein
MQQQCSKDRRLKGATTEKTAWNECGREGKVGVAAEEERQRERGAAERTIRLISIK